MAIRGLNEEKFRELLRRNLTPARAISSPEHLKGRAQMLQQINRAFNSPGKHVFIYGDRGVGKTSLAQTAAFIQQPANAEPIFVACGGVPFLSTVHDAIKQAVPAGNVMQQKKIEHSLKVSIPGIGYDMTRSLTSGVVPPIESVNDAVQLFRIASTIRSSELVFVFDEFDQLEDDAQQKVCADVIKQISDRSVNVRLILCGIGSSLADLIGVHLSSGRYLSPIHLERLTHDARWEILESAAEAMQVSLEHGHLVRIGQISDGFPSYVHLIGEHLLWSMFDDPMQVSECTQLHFEKGIHAAVQEAETTLRIVYEKAVQKYSDDYQEVLWALADGHLLRRQTKEIFEKSYLRIMESRPARNKLKREQFSARLNRLKTSRHEQIIVGKGAGWYEFKENIVRGYVRLRAEHEGVHLGVEGFA